MDTRPTKTPSAPCLRTPVAGLFQAVLWLNLAALLTSGAIAQTLRGITRNKEGHSTILIRLVNGQPTLIDLDLVPEKSFPGNPFVVPEPYTYQGVAGYLSEYAVSPVETYTNHLRLSRWRETGTGTFSAILRDAGIAFYQDGGFEGDFSTDPDGSNPSASFFVRPPTSSETPFAERFSCRVVTKKSYPPGYAWSLKIPSSGLTFVEVRLWRTGPGSWGIKIETLRTVVNGDVGSVVAHTQTGTLHAVGSGS